MKLLPLLQEIQIKQPSIDGILKQAVFTYYKRRLNNPDLDADDRYIGNISFDSEEGLKEILNQYFKSDDWDKFQDNVTFTKVTKSLLKSIITDIKFWSGDYDREYDDDLNDIGGETTGLLEIKTLLREMSEGLIKKMLALYQPQTQDSEEQITANLKRFEQLAGSIAKKLEDQNPIILSVLPDELKAANVIKDITKYKDYDTLIKVLKAADTKAIDPYKQAIDYFKKVNKYIEPRIIGSYVARFKQNLADLEQQVQDKDRNTLNNIPKELLKKDAYKIITNWRNLSELEHMLDALFPLINQGGEDDTNDASTNGDLIYEKDGIEVYIGDEEHKCIKYSKGYSWCIGDSMYASYRYNQSAGHNRLFYFVFDRNEPKTNKWHVVVIHVNEKGLYLRTSSKNDGDEPHGGTTWDKLGDHFPGAEGKRFWNRIKGLQNLFKFKNPNKDELRRLGFKNKRLTIGAFAELDPEDKRDWARANASDRQIVTPEIAKSLPAFGEPSKNDLINYGREFSMDELKPTNGLIKRYAEYTLAHRKDKILPPEFIPYLKPETKENYYEKNAKEFLNYDFIYKYFGEEQAKQYIKKEAEELNYIPPKSVEFIPDEYKHIYSIIFKFQENWKEEVNESEGLLSAEVAVVVPIRISYKQFITIPQDEKREMFKLIINNPDNINLLYSAPTVFMDNGKFYSLLPTKVLDSSHDVDGEWVIVDDNDKIIKTLKNIDDLKIDGSELYSAESSYMDKITRFHDLKKVTVNQKPILNLHEILDWDTYSLQRKAGIIK